MSKEKDKNTDYSINYASSPRVAYYKVVHCDKSFKIKNTSKTNVEYSMSQSGSQKKSGFSLWFRKKTSKNIPNNNFSSEQLRVIQSWRLNDFLIEPIDVVQRSVSTRNQGASGYRLS